MDGMRRGILYIREEGKDQSATSSIEFQGVDLSIIISWLTCTPRHHTRDSHIPSELVKSHHFQRATPWTKSRMSNPLTGNSILEKSLHTEIKSIAIAATRSLRYAYPDLVITQTPP